MGGVFTGHMEDMRRREDKWNIEPGSDGENNLAHAGAGGVPGGVTDAGIQRVPKVLNSRSVLAIWWSVEAFPGSRHHDRCR
jgi:hypothetical protein